MVGGQRGGGGIVIIFFHNAFFMLTKVQVISNNMIQAIWNILIIFTDRVGGILRENPNLFYMNS